MAHWICAWINGPLTPAGLAQLIVDSGPVVINVMGTGAATAIDLGGGLVMNTTQIPANLGFTYAGALPIELDASWRARS